jgi:protoporphyrinogen oxidase
VEKQPLQTRNDRLRYAVIIGAGPAGLTAAYELLTRTNIVPIVLEKSDEIGGLSRTVNYKGNRIDIGGHRFFSKSQRVMTWWLRMLPLESSSEHGTRITYRGQSSTARVSDHSAMPENDDRVMLIRNRRSRIYFNRQLFNYPLALSGDTLRKLGLFKSIRIVLSYLRCHICRGSRETNLEEFLIHRFGQELYRTFFKTYTEKVWGISPNNISAEWGTQRIRGLSLKKMAMHHVRRILKRPRRRRNQQRTETSLIEQFLYPKFGPGQMWEEVASRIKEMGGEVLTGWDVKRLRHMDSTRIEDVMAVHSQTGETRTFRAEYVFSTMPVKELVTAMTPAAPPAIKEIAAGLEYREFITVGVLYKAGGTRSQSIPTLTDNWIYIQEPGIKAGRLQVFNNWSPAMVADGKTIWIGVEYFCNEADDLWRKSDRELIDLATAELAMMELVNAAGLLDATVIRAPKAYPAYFGTYHRFTELSSWTDRFENLFLIGRNGMHRYNNQDHSMLTAMVAVDNIVNGVIGRENLWTLNTEQEYQEEEQQPASNVA